MSSFVGVTAFGLLIKFGAYLATVHIQWSLVLSAVAALGAMRVLTVYKNRKGEDRNFTL